MRFLVVISSAALVMAASAWAPASAQADRPLHLSAESALLLAPDGTVLFAKNPSEDHAPASLVKLMTLYLACEALEAGRAQWEESVTISRRAAETPRLRDRLPIRRRLVTTTCAGRTAARPEPGPSRR